MEVSLSELAQRLDAQLIGDGNKLIRGVGLPEEATSEQITFAENKEYFKKAIKGDAGAIISSDIFEASSKPIVLVKNVRVAMAYVLELFYPEPELPPGIHPTAIVSQDASVEPTATIGPYCVIEAGAVIGAKTILCGFNYIGYGTRIGSGCKLFPHVTIYHNVRIGNNVRIHSGSVIGADGYGYVFHEGKHLKIPQVGSVIIEDEVEIGANVTIDRGTLGPTFIGKGTKIDNLVQIAHNVTIGQHCLLVSQVGIAGSTKLGNYVTLAGQVGLAGHLTIGDKAIVGAKSGVMNSVPPGEMWLGIPALPAAQAKRQLVAIQHLPELLRKLKELEHTITELKQKLKTPTIQTSDPSENK